MLPTCVWSPNHLLHNARVVQVLKLVYGEVCGLFVARAHCLPRLAGHAVAGNLVATVGAVRV